MIVNYILGLVLLGLVFASLACVLALIRNVFVYRTRTKILQAGRLRSWAGLKYYESTLPGYDAMMKQWRKWDYYREFVKAQEDS